MKKSFDEIHFPSEEDLSGAAIALMRLQDTYQLDTHALAKGELLGKKYSRALTGKTFPSSISKCKLTMNYLAN